MANTDLLKKLQKLHDMATMGTTHEAANARRLLDMLLRKHELSPDILEHREQRLACKSSCDYDLVSYVAQSLGLTVFKNNRSAHRWVEATATEFEAFERLVNDLRKLQRAKLREAKHQVASFMLGTLQALYPPGEPKCPTCGGALELQSDVKYHCQCGWVSKRLRDRHVDGSAFSEGRRGAALKLTHQGGGA